MRFEGVEATPVKLLGVCIDAAPRGEADSCGVNAGHSGSRGLPAVSGGDELLVD